MRLSGQKALIWLLLLLLPTQLGYHLWPDWSLINGIRVDYLSPTLYLTDVVIVCLMILSRQIYKVNWQVIAFAVLNTAFSVSPPSSLYHWLKGYEFYWLYRYLSQKQIGSFLPLRISIWVTATIAWLQLLLQRSVGGGLYWLGERSFTLSTPGIAKVFLPQWGMVLRPYSIFSHPNALAGWLLVSGLIAGGIEKLITLLTLPITFSRSVLFVSPVVLWKKSRALAVLIIVIFVILFSKVGNPTSISERLALYSQSGEVIKNFSLLGVGLGNFVYQVPDIRQPVHNIYLLLVAELGLPAAAVIGIWGIKKMVTLGKGKSKDLVLAMVVVMTTGLVDHYWLTQQQNILLLVVLAALVKINHYEVKN